MQRTLSKILTFIRRLGLKNQETKIETIASNVFNLLLIPLFFVHLFFFIRAIFEKDPFAISINGTAFGVMLVMLILNYFNKHKASVNYFNFIYPLFIGIISSIIGEFDGLDYSFFVFILTSIIFSKSLQIRIFFTIYNVSIYHFANQYILLQPLHEQGVHGHDREIIFSMTAISIFAIISYFYTAIIKHEKDNQKLVESLTKNNEKLNVVNQELERFNHIASHDLKTPLRSIMSFSSLIQRDLKKESYENVDEYFQFIKNSAKQMHNLITDTLEYSKVEQESVIKEKLDLNKIITNLSRQIKSSHSGNIEIRHSQLPHYYGQESLFIRLFQNIFENGIKYNRNTDKFIDIDFKIKEDSLILEIQDNGIGIEQEYLDEIFVLFKRLHTSNEFTGTGLGLSICKKIVEQLNGSIWADSEIGNGSTFYISLPLNP